jgi:hypothetical protein
MEHRQRHIEALAKAGNGLGRQANLRYQYQGLFTRCYHGLDTL